LKILGKIGDLLALSVETKFQPFGHPRNFGKSFTDPPANKTSDAQVQGFHMNFDFSTVFTFEKLTKEAST